MSLFYAISGYLWNVCVLVMLYGMSYFVMLEPYEDEKKATKTDKKYQLSSTAHLVLKEPRAKHKSDLQCKKVDRSTQIIDNVGHIIEEVQSQSNVNISKRETVIEARSRVIEPIVHVKNDHLKKKHTLDDLFQSMLYYVPSFAVNGIRGVLKQKIFDDFKKLMEYLSTHPIYSLPLFAIIMFVGIPISIFSFLAIVSVVITFSGFLIVEGTLIGIGAIVTGCFVLTIFGFVFSILFGISLFVYFLQKIHIL